MATSQYQRFLDEAALFDPTGDSSLEPDILSGYPAVAR